MSNAPADEPKEWLGNLSGDVRRIAIENVVRYCVLKHFYVHGFQEANLLLDDFVRRFNAFNISHDIGLGALCELKFLDAYRKNTVVIPALDAGDKCDFIVIGENGLETVDVTSNLGEKGCICRPGFSYVVVQGDSIEWYDGVKNSLNKSAKAQKGRGGRKSFPIDFLMEYKIWLRQSQHYKIKSSNFKIESLIDVVRECKSLGDSALADALISQSCFYFNYHDALSLHPALACDETTHYVGEWKANSTGFHVVTNGTIEDENSRRAIAHKVEVASKTVGLPYRIVVYYSKLQTFEFYSPHDLTVKFNDDVDVGVR